MGLIWKKQEYYNNTNAVDAQRPIVLMWFRNLNNNNNNNNNSAVW